MVVLILGRFSAERKLVLDALRDELRKSERNYVPVVFDFEQPDDPTQLVEVRPAEVRPAEVRPAVGCWGCRFSLRTFGIY